MVPALVIAVTTPQALPEKTKLEVDKLVRLTHPLGVTTEVAYFQQR
jgi:hypothetical protein